MKRIILSCALFITQTTAAAASELLLAKEYTGQNVSGWAMSEKFAPIGTANSLSAVKVMRLLRPPATPPISRPSP